MATMEQIGTPWAEQYRGSGRLTGHVAAEPTYMNTGEVAPGWLYVGEMTENVFWEMAAQDAGEMDEFQR